MSYTKTNWQNLPNTSTPVVASSLNNMENGIKQNDTVLGGEAYDSTATYEIGDVCIYNDTLYKCTTAITTAEAWNSSHWTATTINDEIDELRKSGGIPTNSVIGYDGSTIPGGFEEVSNPNIYSANEIVIGEWFGKPLYRKVLFLENTEIQSGNNTISHSISGLKELVNANLKLHTTGLDGGNSNTYMSPMYKSSSSYKLMSVTYVTKTNCTVYSAEHWSEDYSWYIIFEYTKTTD